MYKIFIIIIVSNLLFSDELIKQVFIPIKTTPQNTNTNLNQKQINIQNAQRRLKQLGYYDKTIDGRMGFYTKRALMNFQKDIRMKNITGILDNETLDKLKRPFVKFNTHNFAPFHYKEDDNIQGPVYNIVKKTCKEAKINCTFNMPDNWGEAQEEVKNGKKNGLFVIGWNAERAKYLNKSLEVAKTAYGFFVKKSDNLNLKNLSNLNGYKVGVYGPSNTSRSLKSIRRLLGHKKVSISIVVIPDNKELFKELNSGSKLNAVYSNKNVGLFRIKIDNLTNIKYASDYKQLSYYVGFSKNTVSNATLNKFNTSLKKLNNNGELEKYFSYQAGFEDIHKNQQTSTVPLHSNEQDRFSKKGSNLVKDKKTCLIWQKGGSEKEISFENAKATIENLNNNVYEGYSDWRIPTKQELETLLSKSKYNDLYINKIFNPLYERCWSNTIKNSNKEVYYMDFYEGKVTTKPKDETNYLKAVRGNICN